MSKESFDYSEQYKEFYEKWDKTVSEAMKVWTSSPLFSKAASENSEEFDPMSHYKKFYEIWEQSSSTLLEEWVNSPLFAASMGRAVEKSSELKKHFDEVVERTLKNMHFPSKSDIEKVQACINNLEAKINDLSDKIEEIVEDYSSPTLQKQRKAVGRKNSETSSK